MSRASIKGVVTKVFELQSGDNWTRLDMKVDQEGGSGERMLKVWGGDKLQVSEGDTIEAFGKLEEYKGDLRVIANLTKKDGTLTGDVTVNGTAPTAEQAKTVLSGGPSVSKGQRTLSEYVDFVAEYHPKFKGLVDSDEAAKSYVITAWIDISKGGMVNDIDDDEPVPF